MDPPAEASLNQTGILEQSKVSTQSLLGDLEIPAEIGCSCPTSTEADNDVSASPIGKCIKDQI